MKVEYIKCDICGNNIGKDYDPHYKYEKIIKTPNPDDPLYFMNGKEVLDICPSCFMRLKAWIKTEFESKEAKDGPST